MRVHEVDFHDCLPGLRAWEGLSPDARLAWVRSDEDAPAMADAADGLRVLLRAADRCGILSTKDDLLRRIRVYVKESFRPHERDALVSDPSQLGAYAAPALARRVASGAWMEELLGARPGIWEALRLRGPMGMAIGWPPLLTPAVHAELVRLVDEVRRAGGAHSLTALFDAGSAEAHRVRATALQAAFRYLALFPGLDPIDATLVVGLVPGVATEPDLRIEPTADAGLEVFDVEAEPASAFLVQDMLTVLVAASAGELRVKANAPELYQRSLDRLLDALAPVSPVVLEWAQMDGGYRVHNALWALELLRLVRVENSESGRRVLLPTPESGAWLASTASEQIALLGPIVRGEGVEDERGDGWCRHEDARRLAPYLAKHEAVFGEVPPGEVAAAVRAALAEIPSQGGVRLEDWLVRQQQDANPMTGPGPGGHRFHLDNPWLRWLGPEEREHIWTHVVSSAIASRLVPLGGVALIDDEEELFLQLTSIGRYLIRASETFELPESADASARIVVQPSYDVVFLGPSPRHEALLAPFAERVGHQVGTLFHLSRNAATRAAAAGLSGEEALARLRDAQGAPLPDNVERSVRDWFARVRKVEAARTLVLRCPDEETAARVTAAGGAQAKRLGPQVVEIEDAQALSRIRKKLEKEGILVGQPTGDQAGSPGAGSRPRRRRRRRRW